jgi:hypothetical protein
MPARRFPSPWSVDDPDVKLGQDCFIVRDAAGQALAYVYFEEEPGRRAAAKLLTRDEARRIAANTAKLLEVLSQSRTASSLSEAKGSTGATCGVTGSEFCETVMGGPAFFFSKASANIRISSRHSRTSEVFTVSPSLISFPKASLITLFLRAWDGTPLPAAGVRRGDRRLLHRPRRQGTGAELRLSALRYEQDNESSGTGG